MIPAGPSETLEGCVLYWGSAAAVAVVVTVLIYTIMLVIVCCCCMVLPHGGKNKQLYASNPMLNDKNL